MSSTGHITAITMERVAIHDWPPSQVAKWLAPIQDGIAQGRNENLGQQADRLDQKMKRRNSSGRLGSGPK